MKIWEQGDVLLFKEEIPKSATEVVDTNILMHGEHTGHAHRLDVSDKPKFTVLKDPNSNVIYLRMNAATPLRHEEHGFISVPPGEYRVGQVREKGMFDDMIKPVVD